MRNWRGTHCPPSILLMLTESSNLSDHDDTLSIHLSAIENLSLLDDDNGKDDDILGDNNINNDDLDLRYWKS